MKTDRKISDILWDAANKYLCLALGLDSGDGFGGVLLRLPKQKMGMIGGLYM